MPAPLLLAAAACADWLITLRSLNVVSRFFGMEPEELRSKLDVMVHPYTFRGKLQSALASSPERPELMVHQTQLARLEYQLSLLSRQFDRAEATIDQLRNRPNGFDFEEMNKAEVFANRIHQQTVRLLKDIQRTQLLLDKAAAEPPKQSQKSSAANPSVAQASNAERSSAETSLAKSSQPESAKTLQSTDETAPANRTLEDLPISPTPTEEEFLHCIVKNRERIRNTPAKERQALMLRLIEEHRANSTKRAA